MRVGRAHGHHKTTKVSIFMRTIHVAILTVFAASPVLASPPAPVFAPCAACHKIENSKNGLGPHLSRIVGRKRASVAGFSYSPAMKAKGGVWSEAELDAYLTNPRTYIPGNRMSFPGYKDPVK
jgi:cytochrome c